MIKYITVNLSVLYLQHFSLNDRYLGFFLFMDVVMHVFANTNIYVYKHSHDLESIFFT